MDETEEMVKMLLAKAKMLSYHCPRCNLPLFEQGKKVVCVKCGEVRVEREDSGEAKSHVKSGSDEKTTEVLSRKRKELLSSLESEKDPKKIVSLLEAISKIEEAQKDLKKS